jgi:hypothetical protein
VAAIGAAGGARGGSGEPGGRSPFVIGEGA